MVIGMRTMLTFTHNLELFSMKTFCYTRGTMNFPLDPLISQP